MRSCVSAATRHCVRPPFASAAEFWFLPVSQKAKAGFRWLFRGERVWQRTARCGGSSRSCGEGTTAPHEYVVHTASHTREQSASIGMILADHPPLKEASFFPVTAVPQRRRPPPAACFSTHRTSQWFFGDWGMRAGTRESLRQPLGRPPSHSPPPARGSRRGRRAVVQDQPGTPPAASTEVVAKEGRKEEEKLNDKGVGRKKAGQRRGKNSKNVVEFVSTNELSSPEHHSAPHNATFSLCPTKDR